MALNTKGEFELQPCPILGHYNIQRFAQWSPEDSANYYLVKGEGTKQPFAMYPVMGRAHINYLGSNQLVFGSEPRGLFKSIDFCYIIVGDTVYKVTDQYATTPIGNISSVGGPIYFAFLVVNTIVFSCFVDIDHIYIYREDTGIFSTVTDSNAPGGTGSGLKPGYIAAFGNRITVSVANSSQFVLSVINLGGGSFNPATCFTNPTTPQVFAQEGGIIRQMGVLNNTLYIFSDYITGVWSNTPAVFSGTQATFPWKQNSTYNWNFGIANSTSLDIDFGMLVFLARNSDGLLEFRMSNGGQPERISSKAIDTLLQKYTNTYGSANPFLSSNSNGFLFQYENTIFYRMSGGDYFGYGLLDQEQGANSIEFNFETQTWHRLIELNGERNRIQNHVYFNFKHLVTVVGDSTVYNMSGQYYFNEVRNPTQSNPQASDAYLAYPFRYERVTPLIYLDGYAEFETEYVQIDFVWGQSNINYSTAPFLNTKFLIAETALNGQPQYIIDENPDSQGNPVFILAEGSDYPSLNDLIYNALYKPTIELYWSDDGGISFQSADVRQFSDSGIYSWRMRWYQLGMSRNRVYKLVCVSPVPIVILGAVMNIRRASGGAY